MRKSARKKFSMESPLSGKPAGKHSEAENPKSAGKKPIEENPLSGTTGKTPGEESQLSGKSQGKNSEPEKPIPEKSTGKNSEAENSISEKPAEKKPGGESPPPESLQKESRNRTSGVKVPPPEITQKESRNRKSGVKVPLPEIMTASNDFIQKEYKNRKTGVTFHLSFYSTICDEKVIQKDILPSLLERHFEFLDDVPAVLPMTGAEIVTDTDQLEQKLLTGYVLLTIGTDPGKYGLIEAKKVNARSITQPEVEFSVLGPKEAFVESYQTNINLIRKRLPIKELVIDELTVGSLSKSKVSILHIEGITDPVNVQTMKDRIKAIEFDNVTDSSYVVQLISDNKNSPFPQLLDTERPDRVVAILTEGKVAVLVDGSPHALIGPTTLAEFFSSFDDYFLNWILATSFRLIRLFAVLFSILITPIYVAVLSYHYELIPKDLLSTLVSSRRLIPLPPILEALFLELTIELLREAGARLPTKVGQTIGIVGGIVIGTASVEAGLTSNVLLIIVALAALASFTTPVYKMGNTIRLIRFPFLLFAAQWGLLGIVFCFSLMLTHLIRLTSLNRPFLEPVYPPRIVDNKDALVRLPFTAQKTRPMFLRTLNPIRFNSKKKQKNKSMGDIDE